jgi:hypothetical protein
LRPILVAFDLRQVGVLAAVKFHSHVVGSAVEIQDIFAHPMLPAKSVTGSCLESKDAP